MIVLSLYCIYRKLYSLALGGNSFSITVETTYHSNKLLSSITAFFKHNWRWLHTLLFFNYLFEANFTLPLEALRLKVWSLNVGLSQPQLFSDLLDWFVGGCQHGSRSLAQESVEVSRYLPYSYSNMIGLLTTGLRQLIYSLLVIGLIEKSVG